MKKTVWTECDMGCIKIYNEGLSCFFDNGIGDITTTVTISTKKSKTIPKGEYLGHFSVKNEAYLSMYDCADEPLFKFEKGRYFVYLTEPSYLYIEKVDEDTHA